ncbi:MAG: hypothetical protein A4S09_14615 [Proteobacteria bacterium SG_bin7]|nr:MAG: hypothetical protein A4S09_14615 [Proteobacteria bacterium SG_bin7]
MWFLALLFISRVTFGAINWTELDILSRQKTPDLAVKKILEILDTGPLEPKTSFLLQKVTNRIFETFYTEKGLNYFEVGKHLAISDPNEAIKTLQKGMDLEPYNGKIFLLWARLSLMTNICIGKEPQTRKIFSFYSQMDEIQLIFGQDLACQEKDPELEDWVDKNSGLSPKLKKYVYHLSVRLAWLRKDEIKMEQHLSELEGVDEKFSEVYFWRSRLDSLSAEKKQEQIDKYVATCSNMSEKRRRELFIEPHTCSFANELKGKRNG